MNNETRKLINSIYSILKESQASYHECAQNMPNEHMRKKFICLSAKHQQMLDALEEEAEILGEKSEKTDTLLGILYKACTHLKSLVKDNTIMQRIEEIEDEEIQLINNYESVLKHTLPFHLQTLLQYQFSEIEKDFKETKEFYHFYNNIQQRNMRQ